MGDRVKVVVFVNTKRQCDTVAGVLGDRGTACTILHGGKSQVHTSTHASMLCHRLLFLSNWTAAFPAPSCTAASLRCVILPSSASSAVLPLSSVSRMAALPDQSSPVTGPPPGTGGQLHVLMQTSVHVLNTRSRTRLIVAIILWRRTKERRG